MLFFGADWLTPFVMIGLILVSILMAASALILSYADDSHFLKDIDEKVETFQPLLFTSKSSIIPLFSKFSFVVLTIFIAFYSFNVAIMFATTLFLTFMCSIIYVGRIETLVKIEDVFNDLVTINGQELIASINSTSGKEVGKLQAFMIRYDNRDFKIEKDEVQSVKITHDGMSFLINIKTVLYISEGKQSATMVLIGELI
jgi:ABC-type transport system involved in cytochrome bd biosynthesis fused ATPase/permease subunit